MNRLELQQLALTRLHDAEVLLGAGQWSGAYYLAGYAVEIGLKACIAKLTNLHDFPDKDRVLKSYTHKIETLVDVARLVADRDADSKVNQARSENWTTIGDWNEQSRYNQTTEADARELFDAISNPTSGVFSWITAHW